MAGLFNSLFGGQKPVTTSNEDADFADFAGAPDPSPASITPGSPAAPANAFPTDPSAGAVPYTKWYRVWERTKPSDFLAEAIILPFLIIAVLVHLWGTRTNKRKARSWITAHKPVLAAEFAHVGFGRPDRSGAKAEELDPEALLKSKTAQEFHAYASGRQNAAFVDVKLDMLKRYNPIILGAEWLFSTLMDSVAPPKECMDAALYVFDGKERDYVPAPAGDTELIDRAKGGNSTFDGFVWAVVNKNRMRKLRDERYDASLTYTKDHPKLPSWATCMSESAEVTEMMLTPELIKGVELAGSDLFEYLIVTDQPIDKPTKLDETTPKKRLHLSLRLPTANEYSTSLPIFGTFLRLPDHLANQAHFRPEVMRKIRQIREDEIKKLKRVDEAEAEEERKKQTEKMKKEERDRKMRGMTADEQRKFLEKEEKQKRKKSEKKMSRKG